ncbi:hypothetical protein ANCCEY_13310 [Ancylostoma ceylanicum]|uniref:Uncharacterized protein n=1 Tax=Ancylostoma ceylanicum TaxID=53326 RepID=A0A0D6L7S8_9BILA|nr:hypothetical protein ANCCEY_13310 [Ancylostoma ceylanicum]
MTCPTRWNSVERSGPDMGHIDFDVTTLIRNDFETSSFIHNLMNDAVPTLTFVELFALALFSIITVRRDYAGVNRYCKIAFAITAGVNMLVTSAVVFAHKKNKTQCREYMRSWST